VGRDSRRKLGKVHVRAFGPRLSNDTLLLIWGLFAVAPKCGQLDLGVFTEGRWHVSRLA